MRKARSTRKETDGIGFQIAAPLTYHFAVRAGYSFMPSLKYTQNLTLDKGDIAAFKVNGKYVHDVDLEGKLNIGNFSLLFDIYPSKKSSFRFTAGAYIYGRSLTPYGITILLKAWMKTVAPGGKAC